MARTPSARSASAIGARLIVIAGANGAGKSTYSSSFQEDGLTVIDPDAIARDKGPTPITAGRITIQRSRDALLSGSSFGMETTLSGHLPIAVMDDAVATDSRSRPTWRP